MMMLSNETERKAFLKSLPNAVRRKIYGAYGIFKDKTDVQKASLLYYYVVKRGDYDIILTATEKWKEYKKEQDELIKKLAANIDELAEVKND